MAGTSADTFTLLCPATTIRFVLHAVAPDNDVAVIILRYHNVSLWLECGLRE
jgi:hypothetical protein